MPNHPKAFDPILAAEYYKERRILEEQTNLLRGSYQTLRAKYESDGLNVAIADHVLGAAKKLGKVLAPQENIEQLLVMAYRELGFATGQDDSTQVPLPTQEDM